MEMEIKMKKLGFGTMRLPVLNQEDPASVDLEQVCKMVIPFMERGFTYFDTAYMYHKYESERAVKKALVDRWPRDRYVLADKLPLSHLKEEADMERFFQEQLEKWVFPILTTTCSTICPGHIMKQLSVWGRLPLSAGKRRRERPAESDFPSMRMLSFWRRFFQNTLSWILCSCS